MKTRLLPLLLVASALTAGCASSRVPLSPIPEDIATPVRSRVATAAHDSMRWDVTKRGLDGRPWLVPDDEVRAHLATMAEVDPASPRFASEATAALDRMITAGERALACADGVTTDQTAALHAAERDRLVQALETPEGARAWLRDIRRALPSDDPHPGRTLRALSAAPAWPFVRIWIAWHAAHEWRGENWRDFQRAIVFDPSTDDDAAIADHLATATDDELLAFYSPAIVQELPDAPPPDYRDDLIGAATLFPDRDGRPVSRVDPARQTVYGYVTHAQIEGEWLLQVNYVFWYPEHPELKEDDPEAGPVEGQMLRITLDQANQPLVAEATYACGCYHRLYPVDALEAAAVEQFGEPVNGPHALAAHVHGHIDPAIPETAGTFDPEMPHPMVYVRSGFHLIAAVRWGDSGPAEQYSVPYELAAYDSLEALPWGDGVASFFGRDGLVRGADRPEARLLYPSGMYHPGTPRIRGIHLVHFDQYDYDDPRLLSTMLRIPKGTVTVQ